MINMKLIAGGAIVLSLTGAALAIPSPMKQTASQIGVTPTTAVTEAPQSPDATVTPTATSEPVATPENAPQATPEVTTPVPTPSVKLNGTVNPDGSVYIDDTIPTVVVTPTPRLPKENQ